MLTFSNHFVPMTLLMKKNTRFNNCYLCIQQFQSFTMNLGDSAVFIYPHPTKPNWKSKEVLRKNLGCVFNSRKLCLCLSLTMHPTLELKTRPISFSTVRYRAPQLSLQLHTSCLSDIFFYTSYFKKFIQNWKFIFRLYSELFTYNNKYV